ncbi:MAG: hypothetical protein Alpg2KO_25800 [Alphaproteobacteria bacterium]
MSVRDWGLLVLLSITWGGSFVFQEVALQALSPLWIVWLRVFGAAVFLTGIAVIGRKDWPSLRLWPWLMLLGLLNNAIPFWCLVQAQTEITAGASAIINAVTPVFSILIGWLVFRTERLVLTHWMGIALA